MWNENLKTLKKMTGMSVKQIAEKTNLPERTVSRIFSGDTSNPYMTTLIPIVNALGGSLDEIFADTKVVVGTETMLELQENVETANAEKDLLIADNEILKTKVCALTSELELVKTELMYTKKLLAVHEYYTKTRVD